MSDDIRDGNVPMMRDVNLGSEKHNYVIGLLRRMIHRNLPMDLMATTLEMTIDEVIELKEQLVLDDAENLYDHASTNNQDSLSFLNDIKLTAMQTAGSKGISIKEKTMLLKLAKDTQVEISQINSGSQKLFDMLAEDELKAERNRLERQKPIKRSKG